MEPRRSKHFLAHIPTIALLVVFAMSAPLGVLFFILRAIDLTGRDRFVLYHHRPLGVGRSRDNNVVVVPGPGSL